MREDARRVDRRVVRDPHAKNLMRAKPQNVADCRLHRLSRYTGRKNGVVPRLPAQGAVTKLGRERRISTRELTLPQDYCHGEVGVGLILADHAKEFERCCPWIAHVN